MKNAFYFRCYAWEQRKFKEFSKKAGKRNSDKANLSAYSVSNRLGLIRQTEQFDGSRLDDLEKQFYKLVNPNEFVYNPARINVGSVAFNNLGKTVIVSSLYVVVKMSSVLDNEFALQYIMSPIFIREVRRNTEGSVREYLFYDNFVNIKIPYTTSIEEQKKIANMLGALDKTIALHQRKFESQKFNILKETKSFGLFDESKDYLEVVKMHYDWEQRKLGVLSKYRRGSFPQPYGNKEWYGGKKAMPFLQVVDVGQELRLRLPTKQTISQIAIPKSVFVPKGSVVVTLQGSIGRVAITQVDSYADRTLLIFESYTQPFDTTFWAYTVQQKFEIEKRKAPGGTIKTITKEALSSFLVSYPTVGEQKLLGNFLTRFDRAIALHQRNCLDCRFVGVEISIKSGHFSESRGVVTELKLFSFALA